jgi:hypothetical protein
VDDRFSRLAIENWGRSMTGRTGLAAPEAGVPPVTHPAVPVATDGRVDVSHRQAAGTEAPQELGGLGDERSGAGLDARQREVVLLEVDEEQ